MAAAVLTDATKGERIDPRVVLTRLFRMPWWAQITLVGCLHLMSWWMVYRTGGTQHVWPHLFYVPILVAAAPFGIAGGVVSAIVATVLCGPLMPLDVHAGEPQLLANWLTRGGFFVSVGALAGTSSWSVRREFRVALSDRILEEIEHESNDHSLPDAPSNHWPTDVAQAVDRGPQLVFQPIYSLDDGQLVAVEALARFGQPATIPPNVWFDAAWRYGRGLELEFSAAKAALGAPGLPDGVTLNINASPALLSFEPFIDLLRRREPADVVVEITEHAIVDDYAALGSALESVRGYGVKVAVDDAGAGFASLRHIVNVAPDSIKIDRELGRDVDRDPFRRALAEALCRFGARTGTTVVAEGIETRDELRQWRRLGAHAAQGFYLARPGEFTLSTMPTYAQI